VPLPDELQCVRAGDGLRAGREVRAGVLAVVHGLAEVDLEAADDAGELEEAEQVDLGVVVDLQSGEAMDRLHEQLRAGGLLVGLGHGVVHRAVAVGVGGVELVPAVAGDLHVGSHAGS
jgi:hypothetical protein